MESTDALPLHDQLLDIPPNPQTASPIFSQLPAEVRTAIWSLALTDYLDPDPTKRYEADTLFTRPAYSAPRRTDTSLLRTCRAVYRESWFLPFILREHTHWLTRGDRAPPEYNQGHGLSIRNLTSILQRYHVGVGGSDGNDKERLVEIDSLRVFAQMFKLEEGDPLADLISTPGLRFRRLKITIRHTDWWYWERDSPLSINGGKWLQKMSEVLPDTVREVVLELESLERKKGQVDAIAAQMRERWFFRRTDGEILLADTSLDEENSEEGDAQVDQEGDFVTRWSGSSTWQNQRWLRDESEPGRIDYYIRTVPFRLKHSVEANGGRVSPEALRAAEANEFNLQRLKLHLPNESPMRYRGPAYRSTVVTTYPRGHTTRRIRDVRLQRPGNLS